MTFTKQIAPARQIDAFRSFPAQTKFAYVVERAGEVLVTVMQTNSNGLDCQWKSADAATAKRELLADGYELAA